MRLAQFPGAFALLWMCSCGSAAVISTVGVGDPGNSPDARGTNAVPGIGAVDYAFRIGTFEVRNDQYAEFLNAVAANDTFGLYGAGMASSPQGGIARLGSAGSYSYSVKAGMAAMPVVFVSYWDAVRFVNWLENGQPTGAQGPSTTEAGTYTLFTSGAMTTNMSARAASATWVLPNESEWHKAAFHQPAADGGAAGDFWLYASGSNNQPNSRPGNASDPNSANFVYDDSGPRGDMLNDGFATTGTNWFDPSQIYLSQAGAYQAASGYYGSFDQGGNVWEWTEATSTPSAIIRGGGWTSSGNALTSTNRQNFMIGDSSDAIGFRVAAIPECGGLAAAAAALASVAAMLMARRLRTEAPQTHFRVRL